jgi:hypothetical protein
MGPAESGYWWQARWAVAALALLSALPLLWPEVPPLVDAPGHMGRYKVQIDLAGSPGLQRFYSFEWALIGNLGVDLLIVPLAKLFGVELATKLIALSIPPLTDAGFLWVAREVHGRVPPTALFAIPFAYGHPFIFGFLNFSLSMAFAFLAFALWLRLARLGRVKLRAALFVPISLALWLTHAFGWGTLGVMAFSAEWVRQHDRGRGWIGGGWRSAYHCLALAPPLLLMLAWRQGHVGGQTTDWFNWWAKFIWLVAALRDRWPMFDMGALVIVLLVIVGAIVVPKLGFSRNLAASGLFLTVVYVLLPRIVFGSAYADMRLVPYLWAVGLLAIRLKEGAPPRLAHALAIIAMAFTLVRLGSNTISFWIYDARYDRELAAVDRIPRGARLVSFVGSTCATPWRMSRLEHLPAMALVRREAFANDQWYIAGAQLLVPHYPPGSFFRRDPSQIVSQVKCRRERWLSIAQALQSFPRDAFDYVWLIGPPPYDPALTRGLEPVWRDGSSVLFRVVDRTQPVEESAIVARERK